MFVADCITVRQGLTTRRPSPPGDGRGSVRVPGSVRGVDLVLAAGQRVVLHPVGRLRVLALDVLLKPVSLDAPLPAPTYLDRGQLAAADHVVHLGQGYRQLLRDLGHLHEPAGHSLSLPSIASVRWIGSVALPLPL